ncbi:hypothetical protein WJX84_007357, partial [Apatococcus fuscideae]
MALTSPRSSSSGSLFSTAAEQKVKMRILHGGAFYQDSHGGIAYRGGDSFLENVSLDWKYAQLVHRLCEKVDRAVSMKYQLPEDFPSLERLITVSDDRDVQAMYDAYGEMAVGATGPRRPLRLQVFLFDAEEEPWEADLTHEEHADAQSFFSRDSDSSDSEQENMAAGDVQVLHWQDTILSNLDVGYANTTGRTIALREFPSTLTESNRLSLLSDGFGGLPPAKASGPFTQGCPSQGPDDSPLSRLRPIASGLPSHISAFGDDFAMPGTPPHAEHGSRAGAASTDDPANPFTLTASQEAAGSSPKVPLSAGRQGSSEGFHLPSHISAFGEDSQELARVPSQKQLAGGANGPHRGHWNDNGFMDRGGMAAAMGLPKGNNPQASGSVGSTDDDPQLQRLAEGMMVAAIDSGGSTAGPDNSIWQPGQGSTSKPPGGSPMVMGRQAYEKMAEERRAEQTPRPIRTEGSGSNAFSLSHHVHHVSKEDVRVLGVIGEGAFGEVSLASATVFGKIAIKWLKPGKVQSHSAQFWREADMLASLNHPSVLHLYGVVVDNHHERNVVGIMTEYMRGGSLSAALRGLKARNWHLSLAQRAELALNMATGLAYLHELQIVHFDLKSDNLLLDGPLNLDAQLPLLKVADFGLSKQKWSVYVTGVRDLRGTLPFMAPEL